MKNYFKSGILAFLASMTFYTSQAQVPVQWSRTLQFEGYWSGLATLTLGDQTFYLNYHTDFKTALAGVALTMDEGFIDPDLGELKGANLIGYNATDGLIHWSSVDNFGTAHEHIGSWQNANKFQMIHQSVQNGQAFIETIEFKLIANNQRMKVLLVATLDGDTIEVIEGTLYKQNNRRVNLSEVQPNEIMVYPNPSDGMINIDSPYIIEEIHVTNEEGRVIYTASPGKTNFSVSLIQAGIYFIRLTTAGKTETHKLIINK